LAGYNPMADQVKYNEEKLIFGVGVGAMMIGAWALTNYWTGLASSLSTLLGGLTAVYAIFAGGHVANKWVDGKTGKSYDEDIAADARAEAQGRDE